MIRKVHREALLLYLKIIGIIGLIIGIFLFCNNAIPGGFICLGLSLFCFISIKISNNRHQQEYFNKEQQNEQDNFDDVYLKAFKERNKKK